MPKLITIGKECGARGECFVRLLVDRRAVTVAEDAHRCKGR